MTTSVQHLTEFCSVCVGKEKPRMFLIPWKNITSPLPEELKKVERSGDEEREEEEDSSMSQWRLIFNSTWPCFYTQFLAPCGIKKLPLVLGKGRGGRGRRLVRIISSDAILGEFYMERGIKEGWICHQASVHQLLPSSSHLFNTTTTTTTTISTFNK